MKFRRNARLDTGQVRDRRGARGLAVGGGAGTILVVIVMALLGVDVTGGTDPFTLGTEGGAASGDNTELAADCRTGADADQDDDCRIVAVVNSVQDYWDGRVRRLRGRADRVLQRPGVDRVRRAPPPRSARSTARPTSRSTSTSASTTSSGRGSVRRAAPSPRPTSSPTSTATTCSTSSATTAGSATIARARIGRGPPRAAGRLLRRRVGRARRRDRADRRAHPGRHRRRARRRCRDRRRPPPGEAGMQVEPRVVEPRIVGPAPALVPAAATRPATRHCDTFAAEL